MFKFKNEYTQRNYERLDEVFEDDDWLKESFEKSWITDYLCILATMPPAMRRVLEQSPVNFAEILQQNEQNYLDRRSRATKG